MSVSDLREASNIENVSWKRRDFPNGQGQFIELHFSIAGTDIRHCLGMGIDGNEEWVRDACLAEAENWAANKQLGVS